MILFLKVQVKLICMELLLALSPQEQLLIQETDSYNNNKCMEIANTTLEATTNKKKSNKVVEITKHSTAIITSITESITQ